LRDSPEAAGERHVHRRAAQRARQVGALELAHQEIFHLVERPIETDGDGEILVLLLRLTILDHGLLLLPRTVRILHSDSLDVPLLHVAFPNPLGPLQGVPHPRLKTALFD
jgi:hypothetical protein